MPLNAAAGPSHGIALARRHWRQLNARVLMAMALALGSGALPAATGANVVDREVAGLMGALEASDCQFNRNGTWYDGRRASSHLRRKYQHVRSRGALPDTETFIRLAASRSSVSGKPYRVRCGSEAAMPSQAWFLARLALLRGPKGG